MITEAERALMVNLFSRYKEKIVAGWVSLEDLPNKCDSTSLIRLCDEAISNTEKYPFDKLNRWLGFVQGVCAANGIIDVDTERDHTRPLFHALYGKPVPTF
jgi:hypothetical protein